MCLNLILHRMYYLPPLFSGRPGHILIGNPLLCTVYSAVFVSIFGLLSVWRDLKIRLSSAGQACLLTHLLPWIARTNSYFYSWKTPLVSRLTTGIYNQQPPKPRYSSTWDVKVVLDHIRSWGPTVGLPQKITPKLAMLLANASQSSKLHALEVQQMVWRAEWVTFSLAAITKMSRPGKNKTVFYPQLEFSRE